MRACNPRPRRTHDLGALPGGTANSPRGPIMIDPATRDIVQNEYMRRVERVNGKLANVEFDTMPMVKDPWKEINHQK